jgi:hypothetical protein
MHCPFCEPHGTAHSSEPETTQLEIPAACARHAAMAVLPGGAPLSPIVAASLEGPGLGFLFNPVDVGGAQGWAAWTFGQARIHAAVLPSRDYFEFEAQHRPEHVTTLREVHEASSLWADGIDLKAIAAYCSKVGWPRFEALQRLSDLWWRRDRYAEALSRAGLSRATTAEQALALMQTVEPAPAPPEALKDAVTTLLALARVRFAGR